MSSSVERSSELDEGRRPSAGLLVRAKEAAKNPHLVWVAERAPSPRQAAIVCQILGLTNEEEKNAKALAVLKRDQPDVLRQLVGASKSKNKKSKHKKPRRRKVVELKGTGFYVEKVRELLQKHFGAAPITTIRGVVKISELSGVQFVGDPLIDDAGLHSLELRVSKQKVMEQARKFAKAYEALAQSIRPNIHPAAVVTIYQDFA